MSKKCAGLLHLHGTYMQYDQGKQRLFIQRQGNQLDAL